MAVALIYRETYRRGDGTRVRLGRRVSRLSATTISGAMMREARMIVCGLYSAKRGRGEVRTTGFRRSNHARYSKLAISAASIRKPPAMVIKQRPRNGFNNSKLGIGSVK